jgi:hypothetical protein
MLLDAPHAKLLQFPRTHRPPFLHNCCNVLITPARSPGMSLLLRPSDWPLRVKMVALLILVSLLPLGKEQSDMVESYHLGVNGYVVKLVNFERFAEAVQQLGMYWLLLNESPGLES